MKAWVFSDLHLKHSDYSVPVDIPDADVCIVAGDVTAPTVESLKWLFNNVARHYMPVVCVAGNHEHYGYTYESSMQAAFDRRGEFPGVHFLENDEVVIDGVRFLGACMWTDFNLYKRPKEGMHAALMEMNDYRVIGSNNEFQRLTPEQTLAIHNESRAWLNGKLAETFAGKTAVVTHHCPHWLSIDPKYAGNKVNPAFTSDFEPEIVRYQPELWVHGHTHSNFDYVVPEIRTRIVCNPRGYVWERYEGGGRIENPRFNPYLVVDF